MYKIQSRLKNAIVKEEFTPDISQVSKKKKKIYFSFKKKKVESMADNCICINYLS